METVIVRNKSATFEYFIIEELECGIVLTGTEIKSIRLGNVSIKESYCGIDKATLYIYNMHISLFKEGNIFNHSETRDKILLAHKKEIRKFQEKIKLEGLTLIPLKVYLKDGLCKVMIALCKGKKNYDKRNDLKERSAKKQINQAFKKALY